MLGRKIGEGGNSDVFEWGNNNRIIKLAKPNTTMFALEREFRNSLIVWKMGLSVPQPYEVVEVENRPGIVFERIHGEPLKERLFKGFMQHVHGGQSNFDWNDIRNTARLISEVHQFSHGGIPTQREFLKKQILSVDYLREDEKKAVINRLDQLPIKNQICHGDPNPNNILMSNGRPVLIDWNDTTNGNPESDLAEFVIMIRFAVLPTDTPQEVINSFDSLREEIINIFIEEYTLHTGTSYKEIDPWIVPIAARKLSADAISDEEKRLLVNEIRIRLRDHEK